MLRVLVLVAFAAALSGCGGGSSSAPSTPPPPPAPPPPTDGGTGGGGTAETNADDCSVGVAGGPFEAAWPGLEWASASPESQGLCPDDIAAAMDYAFRDGQDTGAVLIVRNGRLVAERYAADRDAADLATSWSAAKSFASALIGAALDDGLVESLEQPMADFIPAWRGSAKAAITLRHLLTLRTALALVDAVALYNAADQLQFSIDRELQGEPGQQLYDYSNADVMLAGEVVRRATGMDAHAYLDSRVGAVIGFTGEWWSDSVDQTLTYCCLDATPRRFARFGLLFARGGQWNGETVLSSDWLATSTAPAAGGEYAFYWWPAGPGAFAAIGLHGQTIAVFPDQDLVALRFSRYTRLGDGSTVREGENLHGTTEPDDFEVETFLRLVLDAVGSASV